MEFFNEGALTKMEYITLVEHLERNGTKHSCKNCTPEQKEIRDSKKGAQHCLICGGYYPGDCYCSNCCCDGHMDHFHMLNYPNTH